MRLEVSSSALCFWFPKGPVIGPMVIGGVIIDEKDEEICRQLNIRDSKLIAPNRRKVLFKEIHGFAKEVHSVSASAREIDKQRKKMSLNELEALKMAELIKKFKVKPDLIIIDLPDPNPFMFIRRLSKYIKIEAEIKAEHKADMNYPSVASASIIAKVIRDEAIEKLKEKYGDLGSGYPADPKTKEFLIHNVDKGLPFIRYSWETARRLKKEKKQSKLNEF